MPIPNLQEHPDREPRSQPAETRPAGGPGRVVATMGRARHPRPTARTAALPLDDVLARAVAFRAGAADRLLQRMPVNVSVSWGITHVVEEFEESIFEGQEIGELGELSAGDALVIDDADSILSRRGPNQEVVENRLRDATGPQQYRWYRVLRLRGLDVSGRHLYIRDGTLAAEPASTPSSEAPTLSAGSFSELEMDLRKICVAYLGVVSDYGDGAAVASSKQLGTLFARHGITGSLHDGDNTSLDTPQGRTQMIAIIRAALALLVRPLKDPLKAFRDRLMTRAFKDGGCIAARVTSLSDAIIAIEHVCDAVEGKGGDEPIKLQPDDSRKVKLRACVRTLYGEMLNEHVLAARYKRALNVNWERYAAEVGDIQNALQCICVLERLSKSTIPPSLTFSYNRLCTLANKLTSLSNPRNIRVCVRELGTAFADCRDIIDAFWDQMDDTLKRVDFEDTQDDSYPEYDDTPKDESVDTLMFKLLSKKPLKLSPPKTREDDAK